MTEKIQVPTDAVFVGDRKRDFYSLQLLGFIEKES
jgi:hypothetical protein